jgi:predicted Zn-dependent peptidase
MLSSTIIDRTQIPEISPPEKILIPQAEEFLLDNGIKVYSVNAGTQDVVKIEFVFTDKSAAHNSVLLAAANRLIREGTVKHSALEISEMLDFYGAYLETESSPDFSSIVLFTLGKYLNETLAIFSEVLFEAAYPEKEIEIYKTNNKQFLKVNKEKVSYMARKKINEVLYGSKHSYGCNETETNFDSLDQTTLQDFYKKYYHAGNCTIFIAGKIADTTIKSLNELFGKSNWSSPGTGNGKEIYFESATEKKHFLAKSGALQSAIRIGKRFPDKKHPDFHSLQVLNTVLGGYFGSRLMSNIREDKGFTYGIGSMVGSMLHSGFFVISTEVRSEVTQQALEEIYVEMRKLQEEPVPADELEMVRNYMLGTFMRNFDGPFHLSDRCKSIVLFDLGYDYFDKHFETIQKITPEQLIQLATNYFETNSFYQVVAGKL